MNTREKLTVLVVQRKSHVSLVPFSRSVCARITEALDFLAYQKKINWQVLDEKNFYANSLNHIDIVLFSKHVSDTSLLIAKTAKKNNIPIIYDVDDWMLEFPRYSGAKITSKALDNFLEHLELATFVTVANHRLQKLLTSYRKELVFIPNGFWVEKYCTTPLTLFPQHKKFVFTNADNLKINHFREPFLHLLKDILDKYPKIEFDYFGDKESELAAIKPRMNFLGSIAYDKHKEVMMKKNYHFAIVPLGTEEDADSFLFNSCKNPFKYLEYGGLGIPAIFSKNPIYEDVIKDHENGLLIENTKEAWENALEELIASPELCSRLGKTAYNDVSKKHHIRFSAEGFMNLFTKALT